MCYCLWCLSLAEFEVCFTIYQKKHACTRDGWRRTDHTFYDNFEKGKSLSCWYNNVESNNRKSYNQGSRGKKYPKKEKLSSFLLLRSSVTPRGGFIIIFFLPLSLQGLYLHDFLFCGQFCAEDDIIVATLSLLWNGNSIRSIMDLDSCVGFSKPLYYGHVEQDGSSMSLSRLVQKYFWSFHNGLQKFIDFQYRYTIW